MAQLKNIIGSTTRVEEMHADKALSPKYHTHVHRLHDRHRFDPYSRTSYDLSSLVQEYWPSDVLGNVIFHWTDARKIHVLFMYIPATAQYMSVKGKVINYPMSGEKKHVYSTNTLFTK